MAKLNAASLRQEFEDTKARIAALRADGKVSRDVDASFRALVTLLGILITVLLERTPRKRSQTDKDETAQRKGGSELCEIPPRPKGKRGRIAKSDAHNLNERLAMHEESILRFTAGPDGKGQDQGLGMLPDPTPGQSLAPDLQLSELNGGTRLQSSRRHPKRARRRRRRNDRAASGTDRTPESVKSNEINE
ncbi:MAG: hypothetical protein OXC26_16405 [Albidovulum sp.]|nr:hypothetical protein [Albidovulum sp.]